MQNRSCNHPPEIESLLQGDVRSVSRLLTWVERRDPAARPLLKALYPHTGKASLIGVTGPGGSGKSTLINRMISAFRRKRQSVGVLAVDPSSPLSGGAILGDRLRMHQHFLDKDVFIRSLATRGALGGLSPALFDAIHILDAMGKDIILIETIGAGQDEVEIAQLAEVVLLVLAPGMGDDIQIMKAGLLEIGDLIAVNKTDLPGGDQLAQQLEEIDPGRPVVKVAAEKGEGLSRLGSLLEKALEGADRDQTKKIRFVKEELERLLQETLFVEEDAAPFSEAHIEAVLSRKKDPYSLVDAWVKRKFPQRGI